jgi:hypothetical protein
MFSAQFYVYYFSDSSRGPKHEILVGEFFTQSKLVLVDDLKSTQNFFFLIFCFGPQIRHLLFLREPHMLTNCNCMSLRRLQFVPAIAYSTP